MNQAAVSACNYGWDILAKIVVPTIACTANSQGTSQNGAAGRGCTFAHAEYIIYLSVTASDYVGV